LKYVCSSRCKDELEERREMVRLLLGCPNIDVNKRSKYSSYSHTALMITRDKEIIKMLLKHSNIDLNVKDRDGRTAIQRSYYLGRFEKLKLLIAHGASCEGWQKWTSKLISISP